LTLPAAILLGIVQGLTEFLPVSSSAHLILARAFFGWEMPAEAGLAFDVSLHIGTLAAILVFFRREIFGMVLALPGALAPEPSPPARLLRLIAIGTVPVVIVGLTLNDFIERSLRTPGVAAVALAVGAVLMLVGERVGKRTRTEQTVTWLEALLIGTAQASALIPGVSRSGSTIAVGLLLGMRRDAAARFTFLLAIPAVLAAAAKEAMELRHIALTNADLLNFAVGMIVSGIVGYLTIKYFLRFLAVNRLDVFAYYRLALAAVTVMWLVAQQVP
jgi:undecaprenyl-diphosphatase